MVTFLMIVVVVMVSLYTLIFFKQRNLIFYPEPLPADHQFHFREPFEERTIQAAGLQINSLYFKAKGSAQGVILYFHGNAGSLETWGEVAQELANQSGWDVWILDYPGYGKSEGVILSEKQLHEIAETFYEQIPNQKKVIYGRSIGTGIATRLASEKSVQGLILETPYLSLASLAKEYFRWVPTFLLQFKLRSDKWIEKVQAPILVLHGTEDEVIPFRQGKALSEISKGKTLFVEFPGRHHNDLSQDPLYWKSLLGFLSKIELEFGKSER